MEMGSRGHLRAPLVETGPVPHTSSRPKQSFSAVTAPKVPSVRSNPTTNGSIPAGFGRDHAAGTAGLDSVDDIQPESSKKTSKCNAKVHKKVRFATPAEQASVSSKLTNAAEQPLLTAELGPKAQTPALPSEELSKRYAGVEEALETMVQKGVITDIITSSSASEVPETSTIGTKDTNAGSPPNPLRKSPSYPPAPSSWTSASSADTSQNSSIAHILYCPPEIVENGNKEYDQSADVWMLALAVLVSWYPVMGTINLRDPEEHKEAMRQLRANKVPLVDLLCRMMSFEAKKRPDNRSVVLDPVLQRVDFEPNKRKVGGK